MWHAPAIDRGHEIYPPRNSGLRHLPAATIGDVARASPNRDKITRLTSSRVFTMRNDSPARATGTQRFLSNSLLACTIEIGLQKQLHDVLCPGALHVP